MAKTPKVELEAAERKRPSPGGGTRSLMLAGVPVRERRLQVAGVSTVVLEGGAGPPLVLLHGGIECGGAVWAPVLGALAESHRLVVPDMPGLGESEPINDLDVDTFVEWLVELLRQTCPREPTLVAHSLGGSLAASFAAEHGDLLRRLVIYAAPAIGPYRMPLRSTGRCGPLRAPAFGTKRGALRSLRASRSESDSRAGSGMVRGV